MLKEYQRTARSQDQILTRRQLYLKGLGFGADPFAQPVAEQEAARTLPGAVNFFDYFCDPMVEIDGGLTRRLSRSDLIQPENLFLFAEPGMGKTALRLALAGDCRLNPDAWAINWVLGESIQVTQLADDYANWLAKTIALDFFITIVERFSVSYERQVQSRMAQWLGWYLKLGGKPLQALARQLVESDNLDPEWGLGRYWSSVGRSPINYVPHSTALGLVLRESLALLDKLPPSPVGWAAVKAALRRAKNWGLNNALILVDGVDAHDRNVEAMMGLLRPLLQHLPQLTRLGVYFKFFLSDSASERLLRPRIEKLIAQKRLNLQALYANIIWNEGSLKQMLAQRLRAAGVQEQDLDGWSAEGLEGLTARLIQRTGCSPRCLLQAISTLIDVHVEHNPDTVLFNERDWQAMQRRLGSECVR